MVSENAQILPARRPWYWAAWIGACLLTFLMIYALAVHTTPGQLIDNAMRVAAGKINHPLPELDPENRWIAAVILAPPGTAWLMLTLRHRSFVTALIAAAAALAANLSTQAFKYLIPNRPDLGNDPSYWMANSLPSGHTTLAASAAMTVFLVAPPRERPLIGILAGVWAAGWGAYIYIDAWHRPSDMIAAYLITAAWGLVAGWVIMRLFPRQNSLTEAEHTGAPAAAGVCWTAGLVLVGATLACAFFPGSWAAVAEMREDAALWHWVAGVLSSSGPAFLVAAAAIVFFDAETGRRPAHPRHAGPRGGYPGPS